MGTTQSKDMALGYVSIDAKTAKETLHGKYIDLALGSYGGKVLESTNEFFGEGFHLIKDGDAVEDKNRETANGFWKDGWETSRHNKNTHHSAIIQLAFSGTVAGFDIDTSFFDGSHPAHASIEGCHVLEGETNPVFDWKEILPKVPLRGNSHHYFELSNTESSFTHIRLNSYPDGGIARLRVFGLIEPMFPDIESEAVIDLANMAKGGRVIKTSDDRYGKPTNIILPTEGKNTRDGWQTKRSREENHHDWVLIRLGAAGFLKAIQVDTTHFRGNNPDFISLEACLTIYRDPMFDESVEWVNLLERTPLEGDKKQTFELKTTGTAFSHVKLRIEPDGGLSRFRVFGVRVPESEEVEVEQLQDYKFSTLTLGAKASEEEQAKQVAADAGNWSLTSATATTESTAVLAEEDVVIQVGPGATAAVADLISEVSSVSTLVSETVDDKHHKETVETITTTEVEVGVEQKKKGRGRGKAALSAAVAATKLAAAGTAASKKKAKGRTAAAAFEGEDAAEDAPTTAGARNKRARE